MTPQGEVKEEVTIRLRDALNRWMVGYKRIVNSQSKLSNRYHSHLTQQINTAALDKMMICEIHVCNQHSTEINKPTLFRHFLAKNLVIFFFFVCRYVIVSIDLFVNYSIQILCEKIWSENFCKHGHGR